MIRIDHLIYNAYVCNPLLNDLVIDFDDEPGIDSAARASDQTNFPDCFTHAMVNVRSCEIPRNVLQADTIVVSGGLANFEQSSWSRHRRHEFWGTHEELHTKKDYDKFVRSLKDNDPGMSDGRSTRRIDCRKFDDPDNDRSLRKHTGRNPRITKSILGNYHALHSRYWFFSSRNIVITVCRSGRRCSVANAELWSNPFDPLRSRHQHSVSLLHLSELDFWENTCAGNCSECSKQSLRVFQTLYDQVQAECLRRVPVPDLVTGRWKRPRPNQTEGPARQLHEEDNLPQTSKKQATSATATSAETSTSRGILDELQHDVSRKTDQSMIEAAKCMFHQLLGEARDDLDRVVPR